jgi:hypothetical protein
MSTLTPFQKQIIKQCDALLKSLDAPKEKVPNIYEGRPKELRNTPKNYKRVKISPKQKENDILVLVNSYGLKGFKLYNRFKGERHHILHFKKQS